MEILSSRPWWQEQKEEHDEHDGERDLCHDCAIDRVADALVVLAHTALMEEGQPTNRQHISEALLRAAREANWLTDIEVQNWDETYAELREERKG